MFDPISLLMGLFQSGAGQAPAGGAAEGTAAAGGARATPPGGLFKLSSNDDLLKQTMASLNQPQQQSPNLAPIQRQQIDMSRLASILANRSRLGV